jgi:hypothetical protein
LATRTKRVAAKSIAAIPPELLAPRGELTGSGIFGLIRRQIQIIYLSIEQGKWAPYCSSYRPSTFSAVTLSSARRCMHLSASFPDGERFFIDAVHHYQILSNLIAELDTSAPLLEHAHALCFAKWPARIAPGTEVSDPVHHCDFYSTAAAASLLRERLKNGDKYYK